MQAPMATYSFVCREDLKTRKEHQAKAALLDRERSLQMDCETWEELEKKNQQLISDLSRDVDFLTKERLRLQELLSQHHGPLTQHFRNYPTDSAFELSLDEEVAKIEKQMSELMANESSNVEMEVEETFITTVQDETSMEIGTLVEEEQLIIRPTGLQLRQALEIPEEGIEAMENMKIDETHLATPDETKTLTQAFWSVGKRLFRIVMGKKKVFIVSQVPQVENIPPTLKENVPARHFDLPATSSDASFGSGFDLEMADEENHDESYQVTVVPVPPHASTRRFDLDEKDEDDKE